MTEQTIVGPKQYDWKPIFLLALRHYPVIRHACEAAGINRTTAWHAKQTDEAFAKEWKDAMSDGVDRAEQEAFKRAIEGYEEPVIDKGNLMFRHTRVVDADGKVAYEVVLDDAGQPVPLTVRKHSDGLLTFVLKGRRKEVYAERTEITGADGGAIELDQTTRAARVSGLIALAARRKAIEDLA